MKMKKEQKVLLSAILVSSAIFAIYKVKDKLIKVEIEFPSKITNNKEKITTEIVLQKLSILENKCRGCGKCVRIDPVHFEMNSETKKAMVISSINLDSVNLIQAINSCPVGAISLI